MTLFSTSRMGRTVALTKMIFKKKTHYPEQLKQILLQLLRVFVFLHVVSAVFILAVDLKRKYKTR